MLIKTLVIHEYLVINKMNSIGSSLVRDMMTNYSILFWGFIGVVGKPIFTIPLYNMLFMCTVIL